MRLRFKIPLTAYLVGPSAESLGIKLSFAHAGATVEVDLIGNKPTALDEMPDDQKYFREVKALSFEISQMGQSLLEIISEEAKWSILVETLTAIVNRVFKAIRNFGHVPHLYEISPKLGEPVPILYSWDVEVESRDNQYERLIPKGADTKVLIRALLIHRGGQEAPEIRVADWPEIAEAIEDDLMARPEDEFLTNAIEFMRRENFRLALLESVTCLEVVLSDYLNEYLSGPKKLSKRRIEKFLGPNFGLTARIAGLLNLVLSENTLKQVNIERVIKAIEWRNKVVHRTGHLPDHLVANDIRDGIVSVLRLAGVLAQQRDQIIARPSLSPIAQGVADKHGIMGQNIVSLGKHRIMVTFRFFFIDKPPEKNLLEVACLDLIDQLRVQDKRFVAENHLSVRFADVLNKPFARWQKGKLEIIK